MTVDETEKEPAEDAGGGKARRPSKADWIAARSDFEGGRISLRALAQRLGVARLTVTRRAEKDGWLSAPDASAILKAGDPARVEHRVNRLYRAFDMEINRLERRLGVGTAEDAADPGDKGDAAAEAEKTARTLSSLARTLDTLIELRAGLPASQQEAEKDEDALRRDLAERIQKFSAGRRHAGVSGTGDAGGSGAS